MSLYQLQAPRASRVPLVVSVPHCGTYFPEEVKPMFRAEMMAHPDDTDWFVDRLYDFAPDLGITMISARLSRWVIDLNRDPNSRPLYSDGRIVTALCPETDFLGNPIYHDQGPDEEEVARRLTAYYWPYYQKIDALLQDLQEEFGQVLLWDCHSIRRSVPTIRAEAFPDMILGSVDQKSARPELIKTALQGLAHKGFGLQHNDPFKGGHITRYFGQPDRGRHALQLEMVKPLYMDDKERQYDPDRAGIIRDILTKTLEQLSKNLVTLS
jgi:N-formylglutamate deformylase